MFEQTMFHAFCELANIIETAQHTKDANATAAAIVAFDKKHPLFDEYTDALLRDAAWRKETDPDWPGDPEMLSDYL